MWRGVVSLPAKRFFNLEYADDIVLLCNETQDIQKAINQLPLVSVGNSSGVTVEIDSGMMKGTPAYTNLARL